MGTKPRFLLACLSLTVMLALQYLSTSVLPFGPAPALASGPTSVGGLVTVNTTWTAANSPYIVTSSILVTNGVRLTIEPGVTVRFNSGRGMQVDGELVARGTEADPIVFTSSQPTPAPGDWVNLLFSDTSSDAQWNGTDYGTYTGGNILQYVTVEYAGQSDVPAVKIIGASPLLHHSTISNNSSAGVEIQNGSPTIANSTISNNVASFALDRNGGGVYVNFGTVTLSGNTINNNTAGIPTMGVGGGVHVQNGTLNMHNNTISGNLAGWGGGGLSISSGTVTAAGNTITGNTALSHGSAVYFSTNMSTVTLNANRINGNTGPDALYLNRQPLVNNNSIHDNGARDIYNANAQGSPPIDATNNWWGTANEGDIQARIYDWFENGSLGIVDYAPFLQSDPFDLPPTSGAISGHVYESDGVTPIVGADIEVMGFSGHDIAASVTSSADGSYSADGLADGSYAVYAWAPDHATRWWQNVLGRSEAVAVVISSSGSVSGIDFSLEPGGTISGTIVSQATGLPLASVSVDVTRVDGISGSGRNTSDQNGNFTIRGMPLGQYKVGAPAASRWGLGDDSLIRVFYNNKSFDNADIVTLSAAAPDAVGVNFNLVAGGAISGRVYEADGVTPISGASVSIEDFNNSSIKLSSVNTAQDGTYTLGSVPSGSYRVYASAGGHVRRFWQDTLTRSQAVPVVVAAPSATTGINFSLEAGGSISGIVTSQATGLPLANVSLTATRVDNVITSGGTTDANGVYSVTGLAFGQYRVLAPSMSRKGAGDDGFIIEYYNDKANSASADIVTLSSGSANATSVNFALVQGGSISGHVYEADGQSPIAGASISIEDFNDSNIKLSGATTAQDGGYSLPGLPAGSYRLSAQANGHARRFWQNVLGRNEAIAVAVSAPGSVSGINFSLEAGGTISGTVTSQATGLPLANISVSTTRTDNVVGAGATTDASGNYTLAGLAFGQYKVNAPATNRRGSGDDGFIVEYYNDKASSTSADLVTLSGAAPDVGGVNFALVQGGTISGRVYEADGVTPIPGASIGVQRSDTNEKLSGVSTSQDGTYSLIGLPSGGYWVNAYANGHVRKWWQNTISSNQALSISITANQTVSGIDFSLEAGGTIAGVVTSQATGLTLANISVDASRTDGPGDGGATTNSSGNYTMNGLPFGQYRVGAPAGSRWGSGDDGFLRVYYDNKADSNNANLVVISAVSPGAVGVNFSLGQGGSISGRVTDEFGVGLVNADVWADYWAGGTFASVRTDAQGNYTISGLPAGDYRVLARASGRVQKVFDNLFNYKLATPVHVSAASVTANINFSLEPGGSISGRITGADGQTPVSGASIGVSDFTSGTGFNGATTLADGTFTESGLPAGSYRVNAWANGHVRKYWQNTVWSNQATAVPVIALNNTPNINISLEAGGTISGTVTSQATGLTLANVSVDAGGASGGSGATTNSSGAYTVNGLPFGQYKVSSPGSSRKGSGDDGFVRVYYNNKADSNTADLVTVSASVPDVTGVNFALAQGGSISGHVTDDLGAPIANADVWADAWAGGKVSSTKTDSQGNYIIVGLPSVDYRVQAQAAGRVKKVYDNLIDYNAATVVHVSAPGTTAAINFSLEAGGSIAGTVTSQATGLPLANVNVSAKRTNGAGGGGATTDSNGNYVINYLPFGSYTVNAPTGRGSGDAAYIIEYYNDKANSITADLVTISAGSANATGINFGLVQGGYIVGTVLDQNTSLPVDDASVGSVYLEPGWHRLVYRFEEREGASEARAAFMAPGQSDWSQFGTAEMDIRTAADGAGVPGISLVTGRNNSNHPANHDELVEAVEVASTAEAGWYGEGVVDTIAQTENVFGNDDYFVSRYEAYFFVDTAGDWRFATDSDDASEIEIDGQVVAYWYSGHASAHRWEHKAKVTAWAGTQYQAEVATAADGSYRLGPMPAGSYTVAASASGYANEYYEESPGPMGAISVAVTAPAETTGINFTLQRATGSISGWVYYSGPGFGEHNFYVTAKSHDSSKFALLSVDGAYDIQDVPNGAYLVMAFLDLDDNGIISPGDKVGVYADPVIVSGDPVSDVVITVDETPMGLVVGTIRLQGRQGPGKMVGTDAWVWADNGTELFGATPFPDGTFVISAPAGTYDVHVQVAGYLPATRPGVMFEDITLLPPGQPVPQLPEVLLSSGDPDMNSQVDIVDLMLVAANYGANTTPGYDGDLNGDGKVDMFDLVLVGMNFGKTESNWP